MIPVYVTGESPISFVYNLDKHMGFFVLLLFSFT